MKYLHIILLLLALPVVCKAQAFEDDLAQEWESQIARDEGDMQSEVNPIVTDEIPRGEVEKQEEEPLYPEGEQTDWSLGSEDLPAEYE